MVFLQAPPRNGWLPERPRSRISKFRTRQLRRNARSDSRTISHRAADLERLFAVSCRSDPSNTGERRPQGQNYHWGSTAIGIVTFHSRSSPRSDFLSRHSTSHEPARQTENDEAQLVPSQVSRGRNYETQIMHFGESAKPWRSPSIFPGQKNLDKPTVFVFPKLLVCMDCGFAAFSIPEAELRLLGKRPTACRPQGTR
jgi:hypothetical protein